jgi:hypothetical protein
VVHRHHSMASRGFHVFPFKLVAKMLQLLRLASTAWDKRALRT